MPKKKTLEEFLKGTGVSVDQVRPKTTQTNPAASFVNKSLLGKANAKLDQARANFAQTRVNDLTSNRAGTGTGLGVGTDKRNELYLKGASNSVKKAKAEVKSAKETELSKRRKQRVQARIENMGESSTGMGVGTNRKNNAQLYAANKRVEQEQVKQGKIPTVELVRNPLLAASVAEDKVLSGTGRLAKDVYEASPLSWFRGKEYYENQLEETKNAETPERPDKLTGLEGKFIKAMDQWGLSLAKTFNNLLAKPVAKLVGDEESPLQYAVDTLEAKAKADEAKYAKNLENATELRKTIDQWTTSALAFLPDLLASKSSITKIFGRGDVVLADNALRLSGREFADAGRAMSKFASKAPAVFKNADSAYTAVRAMAENPFFWTSFGHVAGDSYDDAKDKGASDWGAYMYALTNGIMNAAIETRGVQENILEESAQPLVDQIWNAVGDEGMEEFVQRKVEKALQNLILGADNPFFSLDDPNAIINPGEDLMATLGGMWGGLVLGGGNSAIQSGIGAVNERAIGNSLSEPERNQLIAHAAQMPAYSQSRAEMLKLVPKLTEGTERLTPAEIGKLYNAVAADTAMGITPDRYNDGVVYQQNEDGSYELVNRIGRVAETLQSKGMGVSEAATDAQIITDLLSGNDVKNRQLKDNIVKNETAREVFAELTGIELPAMETTTVSGMAEQIRANAKLFRARQQAEREAVYAERQAQAAQAQEAAVEAAQTQAAVKAESDQIMNDAITQALNESEQGQPEQGQQNQRRQSFDEWYAEKEARLRALGHELDANQKKELQKEWNVQTEADGVRLDNGEVIGRKEFTNIWKQWVKFKEGVTLSAKQLEADYQKYRLGSDDKPMSTELWNQMLAAAGEAPGTRAQAQEATGAETQTAAEEAAPVEEAPKEKAAKPARKPRAQKPKAESKKSTTRKDKPNARSKSKTEAKPKTERKTTKKPRPKPTETPKGQSKIGEDYWDSLLTETPPPARQRNSIPVAVAENAAEKGIETNKVVSLEQAVTALTLQPFLKSKGINNIKFDAEHLGNAKGSWDELSGVLRLNERKATSADAMAKVIGHEIFHPATAESRRQTGDENDSVAEDFLTEMTRLAQSGRLGGRAGAEITALLNNLNETLAAYKGAYFKYYKSLGLSDLVAGYKTRDALMREEIACDVMGYAFTSPRILDRMAGVRPDLLTRVVQVVQDIRQKARPEMLTINNIGMFGREDAAMNTIIDRVGKALTDSANRRTNVPEGFEEDNEATDNEATGAEQYALTVFGSGNDQYVVNTDEVKRLHQESVDAGDERRAAYFQSILNNDSDTTREILKQYAEDAGFSTLDVYHGVGGFDSDFIRGFSDRNTESRTRKFFTTPQLNAGAHYAATRGEGWPVDYGKYPLVYRTIQSGQLIHNATRAGAGRTYVSRLSPSQLVAFANLIPGAVFETDTSSSYKYVSDERKANLPTEFAERTSELYDTLSEIRDDVEDDPYIADDEYMRESFNTFMNFLDGLQAHANGDKRWTPERLRSMAEGAYDAYLDLNQLDEYEEGEIDEEPSEALLSFWRALGDEEVFDTLEEAAVMFDKVLDPSATNIFSEDYRTWFSHKQVMARLKSAQMRGVYHLYGRLGDNPLVFDAEEADWKQLSIDQYDRDTYPGEGTTDELVEWADGAGHTSVVIENIYDGGGMVGDPAALMTDYVFLKSQDVKSADLVTFDDNLRIIPPDERFSDSKNWRLSIEVPVEGLYNQSERVVKGLPDGKIGVGQLLRKLQGGGVNADELKWLGINDFVQGKKSVDKQELLDYIRANDLVVEETVLSEYSGGNSGPVYIDTDTNEEYESYEEAYEAIFDRLLDEGYDENAIEQGLKFDDDDGDFYWWLPGDGEGWRSLATYERTGLANETHWGDYTTPGGENYREILFRLPDSDYSNGASRTHWGDDATGVVAHARVQDFVNMDGEDVLFIDEMQSDWHNEGQEKGYAPPELNIAALKRKRDEIRARRKHARAALENAATDREKAMAEEQLKAIEKEYEAATDKVTEYYDYIYGHPHGQIFKGAPEAPFAESYVDFVLKRMLREAADLGYAGIAWTDSEMQMDRWNPDRALNEKGVPKFLRAYQKVYDKQTEKYLNKFGKQFGTKVGTTTLLTDRGGTITVPFFPINEEMAQSVLENGLPKFAVEVPLKEQIDAAMDGNMPKNHYVYFGTTTPLMQKLGFQKRNEPILMRPSKMRRASMPKTVYDDGAHGITPEQFEQIPYYLEHPVLVIDTMSNRTGADGRPTRENNVLFYTDMLDADGQPLVIAVTAYSNYADVTWMGAANESNEKYANIIRTVFGEGPANSQMPEAVKYGPGTRGDSRTGRSFESVVQRAMNSDSLLYVSSEGVKNLLDKAKAWKQEMNQPAPAEGTSPANAFRPKDWLPTPRETWDNWIKFPKGFDKVPKDVVIHKSRNISKPAAQTTKQQSTARKPATRNPATQKPATQRPATQKTAMQLALEKAFQQTQPAPAPKATSERHSITVPTTGLYNQSERVVENLPDGKVGVGQLLKKFQGQGVRADELKWLGINDFLKGKKSVDKQELLDYIRAHDIVLDEQTLFNPPLTYIDINTGDEYESLNDAYDSIYARLAKEYGEEVAKRNLTRPDWSGYGLEFTDPETGSERTLAYPRNRSETLWQGAGASTPGGRNYREILFKMPGSDFTNKASRMHWRENAPGVLAHARVQDFKTPDGGTALLIDEVQSDWHNAGKSAGYLTDNTQKEHAALRRKYRKDIAQWNRELANIPKPDRPPYGAVEDFSEAFDLTDDLELLDFITDRGLSAEDLLNLYNAERDRIIANWEEEADERQAYMDTYDIEVSDDEFWENLPSEYTVGEVEALITWLDYIKQRDELQNRRPEEPPELTDYAPDAPFSDTYDEFVIKRLLQDAVSKGYDGLAWTTGQMQVDRWSPKYRKAYENEYDRSIPKYLNRLGKQFGTKVGTTALQPEDGGELLNGFHYFPITEEMRESVTTNGLPKFAIDVDVPGFDEYMREMAAYAEARMRNTSRAPGATGARGTIPTKAQYDQRQANQPQEQMPMGSGAASRGFVRNNTYDTAEQYAQQLEDYGAMPTRDNLYRDLPVPQRTERNNRVSQTAQSAMDSENITNQALKRLHTAVAKGDMSYATITDRASQTRAEAEITEKGWDRALADWTASIRSGKVTKDNTTMGLVLYNSALAANQPQLAVDILVDLSENVRSGAQAVQAMSMLDKLTPEGRFFGMQRSLQNLKQELRDSLGDRAPNIHFNQRLLKDYLRAKTDEERNRIMDKIYQDLAQQIPPTWVDKLNAWRYMAMLANPRTHVRNLVGNAGFTPVRGAKNVIATGLEAAFIGKGKGRTKALAPHVGKHYASSADQARYQAALNEWGEVENLIQSGGKFQSPMNRIRDAQQVFGTNNDVISKTLGKGVEGLRKFNSNALDVEDVWFSKPAYASSLTQYLKANGITAEQYNSPDFDKTKAREYAIKEAQKATYRDYNKFSDFISGLGKTNSKVVNTFIEAVLPFKRTPANILVRGIEYSPIGLAKGIWDATYGVKNGEKTAAEAIDAIASGLTGTGLMAFGYLLAHLGLLTGGAPKKDKEKAMAKLTGHQNYALELGDGSYTLDWLAPEALPMFVGAELYKSLADGLKGGDELFEPLKRISDPVLEMSMLQSIDDILDTVSYSDSKLGAILASAATSYLSQYVPTFGGQVERTIEDKRYQTYTDKNSPIPTDVQYALAKAMNKVPFGKKADYAQIEYVDEWGRTYNTGPNGFARAFMNFISPGYASHIEETSVDKELARLYEATGEGEILPGKVEESLKIGGEDTQLTGEQYEKYAKSVGQTRFGLLEQAFKTERYKGLSDPEKLSFISDVYKYSKAIGAKEIDPNHELERWMVDAGTARQDFNVSAADYIMLKEKYGTDYLSGDGKHEKAVTAYKSGIPLETYLRVRSSYKLYDAGGTGDMNQKELKAALDATELSSQQKAVMFSLYNKSWKSNPFR